VFTAGAPATRKKIHHGGTEVTEVAQRTNGMASKEEAGISDRANGSAFLRDLCASVVNLSLRRSKKWIPSSKTVLHAGPGCVRNGIRKGNLPVVKCTAIGKVIPAFVRLRCGAEKPSLF